MPTAYSGRLPRGSEGGGYQVSTPAHSRPFQRLGNDAVGALCLAGECLVAGEPRSRGVPIDRPVAPTCEIAPKGRVTLASLRISDDTRLSDDGLCEG